MQQLYDILIDRLLACLGVPTIDDLIQQNRARWLGHAVRMSNDCLPKQA